MKLLGCCLGIVIGCGIFLLIVQRFLLSGVFVVLAIVMAILMYVADNYDIDN